MTSSTLPADPPSNETIDVFYIKIIYRAAVTQRLRNTGTGGWVGLRAGLDGCRKSSPNRDSTTRPSSSLPVPIPTELTRPTHILCKISTKSNCCNFFFNAICFDWHRSSKNIRLPIQILRNEVKPCYLCDLSHSTRNIYRVFHDLWTLLQEVIS